MEERTPETQQAPPPAPAEVHHRTFVQPAAAPPLAAPLAGQPVYVKRAVAVIIDGLIVGVIGRFTIIGAVLALVAWLVRDVVWDGNSPGKKLVGLRAVAEGGRRLTPAESVLRNAPLALGYVGVVLTHLTILGAILSLPVFALSFLLGLAECYFVITGQPRLGDRLAKTHVVDEQAQPAVAA